MLNETGTEHEALNPRHNICVATTSFYPRWMGEQNTATADELRGSLSLKAFQTALEKGYQIIVVDGGSSEKYLDALRQLGINPSVQAEKGMSSGRRQVFLEASMKPDVNVILWTEPEKISMIENLDSAALPILNGQADVVIPGRTKESWVTYPQQQMQSEKRFNYWYNVILRKTGLLKPDNPDLDISFGPRLFRNDADIVRLFTNIYQLKPGSRFKGTVNPETYSNATFFPVMLALEKGYKVKSVLVHYIHPREQTLFETGNPKFEQKRIMQRLDIVNGAIQLARFLINNPQKPSELIKQQS